MKIIGILGAGILATMALGAGPAEAQRYGYDGYRDGRGWQGGRDHHRGWREGRGYDRGYYGDQRRGYRQGYRARTRTVCQWDRGYYGPVRRCFRVRR